MKQTKLTMAGGGPEPVKPTPNSTPVKDKNQKKK